MASVTTEISQDNQANVEAIKDLQEKWCCPTHSKGEFSAVYCYKEPPNGPCYRLSFSNLGMWASEIVSTSNYDICDCSKCTTGQGFDNGRRQAKKSCTQGKGSRFRVPVSNEDEES